MFSWPRLNPDPHCALSVVFPAAFSETTRADQPVESCGGDAVHRDIVHRQVTQHHVFVRAPRWRSAALFLSLDRYGSTAASTKFHHQSDGLVFVQ
jgi:hypothetical protein